MSYKILVSIAFLACIAVFCSCRSHKEVSSESYERTVSVTDTTRNLSQMEEVRETKSEGRVTTSEVEGVGVVEFIETGGTISILSEGGVTIEGVKTIKSEVRGTSDEVKVTSEEAEGKSEVRRHSEGVTIKEDISVKAEEKKTPARRWWETGLIWIGTVSLIIVVIWITLKRCRKS